MRGFAGGSRAWSEDRRVRRSNFQGCAGSGKLAFRTEGCGSSHILGEDAIGDSSRSAESAVYLHVKPSSSDGFVDASQAVVGVGNFYVGEWSGESVEGGRISGGKLK